MFLDLKNISQPIDMNTHSKQQTEIVRHRYHFGGVLLIYEPLHRSVRRLMFFPGDLRDDGQPGVRGQRGCAKVLPGAGRRVKD